MSKSETKGFAGVKRAKRNRMIPRFCYGREEREASFVSDLDTSSHRGALQWQLQRRQRVPPVEATCPRRGRAGGRRAL